MRKFFIIKNYKSIRIKTTHNLLFIIEIIKLSSNIDKKIT